MHSQELEQALSQQQSMHSNRLLQVQDDHQKELRRVAEYWKDTLQQTRSQANAEKEEATAKLKVEIERLEKAVNSLKADQFAYQKDLEIRVEREKSAWKDQQTALMAAELDKARVQVQTQAELAAHIELESTIKRLAEDQAVLMSRLEGKYEGELREMREKLTSPREGKKGKKRTPKLELETPTLGSKGKKTE